jgi:hypothetical protein
LKKEKKEMNEDEIEEAVGRLALLLHCSEADELQLTWEHPQAGVYEIIVKKKKENLND